jgi:outer membrane protein assembly factor BamB
MENPSMPAPLRLLFVLLLSLSTHLFAADWPMWRCDARHGAITSQELGTSMQHQWTLRLPRLDPAWPDEPRMRFDVAYEPVIAGQTMYIASPREDTLLALDTRSARVKWRFFADGPIRFAPAIWGGRVYFGSDDGCVYCLNEDDGTLVWRFMAAPQQRLVLGNERVICTWPARGAPVVEDGRVYFAAGIWPFMGVFVYCLDAQTGAVLWRNDDTGAVYINQPHDSPAFAGVAPQGYCTLSGKVLLVPGGRSTPAGFDAETGRFLYFHLATNKQIGEFAVAANDKCFFNCGNAYDLATGKLLGGISSRTNSSPWLSFAENPALRVEPDSNASVVGDEVAYGLQKGNIVARDLANPQVEEYQDSKGTKLTNLLAPITAATKVSADRVWLKAGDKLVASGAKRVFMVSAGGGEDAQPLWSAEIPGTVESVVAGDGRLLVSTVEGEIHCFAEGAGQGQIVDLRRGNPAQGSWLATELLQAAGVRDGYCLVAGAREASVLVGLARESELRVVAAAPDMATAARLREELWPTGLYGARIAVLAGDAAALRLPPYFASLVVVADATPEPESVRALFASVRPYGGALVLSTDAASAAAVAGIESSGGQVGHDGNLTIVRRAGALPGSANWTHQYGNPQNTVSSRDSLIKAPVGLLWFGGSSNLDILPRHGHGPPEQVVDGRLFIEGPDSLRASDVYTGRCLWKAELPELGEYYNRTYHQPGANALGTNFVATPQVVYVVYQNKCLKLDPATGARMGEITLPPEESGRGETGWGYIAVQGDVIIAGASPMSFGGKGKPGDADNWDATTSRRIVVLDRASGRALWQVSAQNGFRHNAICCSDSMLYCIDRLPDPVLQTMQRRGEETDNRASLVALDLHTGRVVWKVDEDVFGTWLSYSTERDILLQAGRPSRDMLSDEPGDRMVAYRGKTGEVLWEMKEKYNGPPMIVGDTVLTQTITLSTPGRALSLVTGETLQRTDPITGQKSPWLYGRNYGCNTVIASENLITFRSAAAGYFDLAGDGGTGNLGGFKSGCTSNLIVANGVLNAPDYTRTCVCSYQNQTSLAFVHDPDVETWTFNLMDIGDALIRRVGINLGAPGDRLSPGGTLWLDWPSVGGPSPKVDVTCKPDKPEQFRHHMSWVRGGELPWVTASGLLGVEKLSVRLGPADAPERGFTIRLYFVEPGGARPGERLMDVAVQGTQVCSRLDVAAEADGEARSVVREVRGVRAAGLLEVGLAPSAGAKIAQTVLCGLEVIQE